MHGKELVKYVFGCSFLLSGEYIRLRGGASEQPSSLSSPVINKHAYEWKCFRFRYLTGSVYQSHDFHVLSLIVLLRGMTSNETFQLFFEDKVTNEGRYTQIPIPSSYSNVKVRDSTIQLFTMRLQKNMSVFF